MCACGHNFHHWFDHQEADRLNCRNLLELHPFFHEPASRRKAFSLTPAGPSRALTEKQKDKRRTDAAKKWGEAQSRTNPPKKS